MLVTDIGINDLKNFLKNKTEKFEIKYEINDNKCILGANTNTISRALSGERRINYAYSLRPLATGSKSVLFIDKT